MSGKIFRSLIVLVLLGLFSKCSKSLEERKIQDQVLLAEMIKTLEFQGDSLTREISSLADFLDSLVDQKEEILAQELPDPYRMVGNFSSLPTLEDSTKSTVVILSTTEDYEAAIDEIKFTNFLDSAFYHLVRKYGIIAQVYLNTSNQYSRVYPSYDAKNIMDPNIDVKKFNFFYEADLEHNPSKGPVWIPEPYVDPAGKGWILSLIHPVYDGDQLFGVLGIDITVDEIIQSFIDDFEGSFLILNKNGDIVAGSSSAIESLSMPPLKNHVYRETIQSDSFRISDFNLFNSKSREVRKMAKSFILEGNDHFLFEEEAYLEDAVCYPFEVLDWYMVKINPRVQ